MLLLCRKKGLSRDNFSSWAGDGYRRNNKDVWPLIYRRSFFLRFCQKSQVPAAGGNCHRPAKAYILRGLSLPKNQKEEEGVSLILHEYYNMRYFPKFV